MVDPMKYGFTTKRARKLHAKDEAKRKEHALKVTEAIKLGKKIKFNVNVKPT